MDKKITRLILFVVAIGLAAWLMALKRNPNLQRELNLLCWSGYEEPQFLGEFEKQFNVKVNYKTFFGGDGMLTLLNQSPGTYDIVVVDKDYLEKVYESNLISELNPSELDFSDYMPHFHKHPSVWRGDKMFGVIVEWGTSALVFNTDKLSAEDVSSYKVLWDSKVKGKVGIWDWYLPNMGNVSLALGNQNPFEIKQEELDSINAELKKLRPQVRAFHGSPPEIINALAAEETWIIPGSGEWLASILRQKGKPIDWVIPKEGGLIWLDALVIPKDAPNPNVAMDYIRWMMTPQAQVLLSQKQAFNSNVCNRKAYDLLTEEQKNILKVHGEDDAMEIVRQLKDRTLPVNQSEDTWQEMWENFKARN